MEDTYSLQYAQLWRKHWWWQVRHEVVLDHVSRLLPPNPQARPTILDVGCCGGVAFDDLGRFGDVYGIEPDPTLVNSEPRWRHRVRQTGFDRDFHDDRRYDLVLMLDVLEHIEDDAGALKSLHDVLKPGGHAILTVPSLPSLWSVHDEVNHHHRRYRKQPLRRLLRQAGLEVIDFRYLFTWTLGLMYLRKWVANRQGTSYRVSIPSALVNAAFRTLTRMENACLQAIRLRAPIGSSLLAVVRREVSQSPAPAMRRQAATRSGSAGIPAVLSDHSGKCG